ncbi:MAG: 30S ribosomal protein S18 [Candidatus Pacebacteria bacterium]|nr:30S ribosomal protein S18 [Candidatus Paceibacterota bacterium]
MACYFCQHNIREIDFKETDLLKRFISGLAKIKSKKRTGNCAKHQRKLSNAIKRARHLGLLSSTTRQP